MVDTLWTFQGKLIRNVNGPLRKFGPEDVPECCCEGGVVSSSSTSTTTSSTTTTSTTTTTSGVTISDCLACEDGVAPFEILLNLGSPWTDIFCSPCSDMDNLELVVQHETGCIWRFSDTNVLPCINPARIEIEYNAGLDETTVQVDFISKASILFERKFSGKLVCTDFDGLEIPLVTDSNLNCTPPDNVYITSMV